jgi:hypothetical protein
MKYPLKKAAVLSGTLVCASLFFLLAISQNNFSKKSYTAAARFNVNENNNTGAAETLYTELNLETAGLKKDIFDSAVKGMHKLSDNGSVKRDDIITIIDFSQPSTQKRLYVADLKNKKILFNTFVAHGKNSGTLWAKSFSNQNSSLKSSPGFYSTAETYFGGHGYSLRLDGLEKNINDNARSRAIVMHGAPYAGKIAVQALGRLGKSWGCPAVPAELTTPIINAIKDGSCLFIYTPESNYQQHSTVLNS